MKRVLVDNVVHEHGRTKVVHQHDRQDGGHVSATDSKGMSVMEFAVIPGTEAKVNEALMNIVNMKETPAKGLLANSIKACGGRYGDALAMAQKLAMNEWTENGFTSKHARQEAAKKYPELFVP